ncbi:glycerol-3-phosphate transporter [Peptostreptococcaceae bacterium oral taxon 929]|nr:glycerol-3-phosphate transporter [Peptostreptococcaceae bacterium oral taxon 929]
MKFLGKSMDSYPRYYKIVGILILMFLLYKFGYLIGKFVANINL